MLAVPFRLLAISLMQSSYEVSVIVAGIQSVSPVDVQDAARRKLWTSGGDVMKRWRSMTDTKKEVSVYDL